MHPDDLPQKLITTIKYDLLPSHSEEEQTITLDIFPGKFGLEF
jgi:hypothetical protein